MEVMGELAAGGALRWAELPAAGDAAASPGLRSVPVGPQSAEALAFDGGGSGDLVGAGDLRGSVVLARCLGLLAALSSTAIADAGVMRFREAADFAAGVEEIFRAAEYLQVVAAGAVDRTRREAVSAARAGSGSGAGSGSAVGWTTGWGNETAVHGPIGWVTGHTSPADGGPGDSDRGTKAAVSEVESHRFR